MKRCAVTHHKISTFMFATCPRCDNFLLSCLVGRSEVFFTCLNVRPCDFIHVLVQVLCFFLRANCTFASMDSAQLPSCSYDRAFEFRPLCSPCCLIPKVGPFFSRSFTNRSPTPASRDFWASFSPMFCEIDFAEIADTPCRKSPFAMNVCEVMSSSAWVCSNVLANTTE